MNLTIPHIPPSLNKYAGRKNHWEYRQEKENWLWIVRSACTPPREPIKNAIVSIVFYFPDNRRRDTDNYQKMVLDGLVKSGVIQDDCWQCVELHVKGAVDKSNPRTEITIEPKG